MVSLRNYFTMAVVICVIFCMFQFSGVTSELLNDYERNPYVEDVGELPGRNNVYETCRGVTDCREEDILYIGEELSPVNDVVKNWSFYKRRSVQCCSSLKEYQGLEKQRVFDMAVINSKNVDWESKDTAACLKELAAAGTNLIFSDLPEVSVIREKKELQSLFGINGVREKYAEASGIHLYEGFLLGGEQIYYSKEEEINEKKQDMQLIFPWYELAAGTKTYMSGIMAEETVDYTEYPPVIWRNSLGSAFVFAINGTYMEGAAGLGLLSAMSAQAEEYDIYPIINAQNLIVLNYPSLAEENEEEMMRRYNRSSKNVFRDIMWPGMIKACEKSGLGFSVMMTPQYDYEDNNLPEKKTLIRYMKLLNEWKAETGASGFCTSNTEISEKLREDALFFQEALPDYRFTSFYAADLPEEKVNSVLGKGILTNVRTVVSDYEGESEIVGYVSDQVTKQVALTDGLRCTYWDDFQNRCAETALGYSSVWIDAAEIICPEDNGIETWRDVSKYLASDLSENWKNFRAFSDTTVSECDSRIRDFLSLEYKVEKMENQIVLELDNFKSTSWFILRMNLSSEVRAEGGKLKKLEEGAYLIQAENEKIILTLTESGNHDIFG